MANIPVPVLKPEVVSSNGITGVLQNSIDVIGNFGGTALGLFEKYSAIKQIGDETVTDNNTVTVDPEPVTAPVLTRFVSSPQAASTTLLYGAFAFLGIMLLIKE